MGVPATACAAAATPPAIAILLLLVVVLLVRQVDRKGGSFEVDWKTVAFRIKYSSNPDGLHSRAEAQDQTAQPEVTAASVPQPAEEAARPPAGGGGP